MKRCGTSLHTPEHFEQLEKRGFAVPAEVKNAPRPAAVIEWWNPVSRSWLPLCAECEAIGRAIGEQADREFAENPVLQKERRELADRYRPVQRELSPPLEQMRQYFRARVDATVRSYRPRPRLVVRVKVWFWKIGVRAAGAWLRWKHRRELEQLGALSRFPIEPEPEPPSVALLSRDSRAVQKPPENPKSVH